MDGQQGCPTEAPSGGQLKDRGYLVAVPSVFRSGVEESVSVTIFNPVKETTVQIQLVVKGEMVARAHGVVLGKGTIKLKIGVPLSLYNKLAAGICGPRVALGFLQVPAGLRGQAHLKVWGNRHLAEEGYIFYNHTTVTVDSKGASVFIQTDKPIYRPKQKVLINFFTVSPDLRPINERIEAYLVDPRGSRMIEWNNLKPVCCGVLNVSFPLSDQPVFGDWLVFAEMQGHKYNTSFEVQKYVLPKFELQIVSPPYIRDFDVCEKATVHASPMEQPVMGRLVVNMTVNGVGYYRHESGHPVLKTTEIDGSADFDVCVKDMMPADVPEHFRGTVNIWATVTSTDGSRQVMFDDSTAVQKQLVDIKYTKDTWKQFKPGLPYRGKVEVTYPDGSLADGVTVRIKAELAPKDNIYTSELVSHGGLVEFEIPSIPPVAQYIWLETKVTALNGKPARDQYLPNYLSISSWYSPSKCHLQLQMPGKPFKVGEEARIAVKSTCPCNFTLHYEVVSRGNIILSGMQPRNITLERSRRAAPWPLPPGSRTIRITHVAGIDLSICTFSSCLPAATPPTPAPETCMTAIHFQITSSMVPLGRLLAYYVRENGEGVADSLQFAIKPSFENQVSVAFSANETRPGDSVAIKVRATKGSCVCLAAVDKSVYLLKPGFQLDSAKASNSFLGGKIWIFQELAEYDVSDAFGTTKEDGHFWWPGVSLHSRRRRSSIFPWHWDVTKDARFAFTETGLVVMTDLVSLNHRQNGGMYTDEAVPAFQPHTGTLVAASPHPKALPRFSVRYFFDINPSQMHFGCASGAGWAERKAQAKRPGIPGSCGQKLPSILAHPGILLCPQQVHVKISIPKGIRFVGHPGKHHLTRKKCVGPGKAKPTSVVLSFSELGQNNITAKAFAYGGSGCCQESAQFAKNGKHPEDTHPDKRAPLGVDYIRRSIIVEPEGLTREYTYSVFFCPNEKIHISTPNKYEYQYVQKPARMMGFEVAIKAHNDAHVALSLAPHDMAEMIEIVIGGHQNSQTWISTSKMGDPVASAQTEGILSWDEFRTFWIQWSNGVIQVGHGPSALNESVIVSWAVSRQPEVKYVGFSTGWGSGGEFKIWRKEEADGNHNEAFTLGVPHNIIPGSERATASVIGMQGNGGGGTDRCGEFTTGSQSEQDPEQIGGIHGKTSLTAYVVAALLETGVVSEEERGSVAKAKHFLESNVYPAEDPYTAVLTAYALTLLRSPLAPAALRKMNSLAITQDGFTHWSLMGTLTTDEGSFMGFNDGFSQSVVSAEVEMTAYALLTYTVLGDVASALPVVKWLSQQRNALGGFSSTQDTCVALQALAEYAILSYIGGVNLTISLASTNLDYQETFELNKANKKILQTTVIPSVPTGLFVSARGEGCCLLQIDVAYNVPDPVAKPAFQLLVNLQEPRLKRHRRTPLRPPKSLFPEENRSEASRRDRVPGDDDDPAADQDHQEYKVIVETCMRWLHSGSSNMAVLEVPLFSGFQADIESLEQIPSQCMTCVKFVAFREYIMGKTAPLPIRVYDYYEPAFEATRFYNVSESSPLARELCDGPMCNEVESTASHWVGFIQGGHCNSVYGCLADGYFEQCMCARDCGYDGEPVCGSDGRPYQNHCQMEVAACRNSTQIEQVPMSQCGTGTAKITPEERETPFQSHVLPGRDHQAPTEEGPAHPLDFSYYSYEYDSDPYASEGDTFELTTSSGGSTVAPESSRIQGVAETAGE
ncbi:hypothetical protein JD844_033906 [Phrynosoma platyrhinos]|uniref:Kazal-like domain-containing protein n=1 Tax=Phrynosoma platyrhinos TaxID=52577 RepID=A0ABQ7T7J2_PHRPL|nr:hypothetical protein JD844_033906 [Phrynosoma platyrhinos]